MSKAKGEGDLRVWKFYADCGRMGSLEGIFLSSARAVEASWGKEAYFGEVLGKHSEIYFTLKETHFTDMKAPDAVVRWLIDHPECLIQFDDALAAQALDEGWCPGDDMGAYR